MIAYLKVFTISGAEYTIEFATGITSGGSAGLQDGHLATFPRLGASLVGFHMIPGLGIPAGQWNSSPVIRIEDQDGDVLSELPEDEVAEIRARMEDRQAMEDENDDDFDLDKLVGGGPADVLQ